MKEMGMEAWKWAAAAALMALLSAMMITGLGSKRGTLLHSLRLSLWMLILGLGAGCSETTQIGHADTESDTPGWDTSTPELSCYADMDEPSPDTHVPDTEEDTEPDFSCVECYQAPWDPEPDSSTDPDDDIPEEG